MAELDKVLSEFNADASCVYLTGLSMGGNGAWYLAYHHANRFAGVLVVCGFVEEFTGTTSGTHYRPIVYALRDLEKYREEQTVCPRLWAFGSGLQE